MTARIQPGFCQHCGAECADRLGSQIWPNRPDLASKVVWCCPTPGCGGRVGSHEATGAPLGTAANPELRKARELLHGLLDPLWANAFRHAEYESARMEGDEAERRKALAIIKRTARTRVYRFLADRMGLSVEDCHVAMFSLEECRAAWRVLAKVSYDDVREWAHANPAPKPEPKPRKKKPATQAG